MVMNRSFRAQESQMLGHRQQQMMREKEEDLALFLEMRKREKERNDLLLNSAEEFDAPLGKILPKGPEIQLPDLRSLIQYMLAYRCHNGSCALESSEEEAHCFAASGVLLLDRVLLARLSFS